MTLRELLKEGSDALTRYHVPEAELCARLLLCSAFGRSTAEYLLDCDKDLSELMDSDESAERIDQYEALLNERANRRPMEQILGEAQFMGLTFSVNEDVLVPRQDTETLVEAVLSDVPQKNIRLLDMCTGSGCIALSLFVLGGYEDVVAADLSRKALYVAQSNGARLKEEAKVLREESQQGMRQGMSGRARRGASPFFVQNERRADTFEPQLHFVQSDLFRDLRPAMDELGYDAFDVITANPPYIRTKDIDTLEPEVRDYEPRMALDGAEDGLAFYRRIAKEAVPYLADGGRLYLEIGADEAADVSALLKDAGFSDIEVIKDLACKDRVVKARYDRK